VEHEDSQSRQGTGQGQQLASIGCGIPPGKDAAPAVLVTGMVYGSPGGEPCDP
jgi:hypothetical protein